MKYGDPIFARISQSALQEQLNKKLLHQERQTINIKGLYGDAWVYYMAASVLQNNIHKSIWILENEEHVNYVMPILEKVLENYTVLSFPCTYEKNKLHEYNASNNVSRTEVLENLLTIKNTVVLSFADALAEKVIAPNVLQYQRVSIIKNDKINLSQLFEKLNDYKFEKTDFVYEAGQFAVRGGIIDIFSFGSPLPYRIELNGNLVESIRIFNPETQLSEQLLERFTLSPNASVNYYSEHFGTFFDYVPQGSIFIFKEYEETILQFKILNKKNDSTNKNSNEALLLSDKIEKTEPLNLVTEAKIISQLQAFTSIIQVKKNEDASFVFNTKSQQSFNRDFKLLSDNLQEYAQNGFKLFIATSSQNQFNRVENIVNQYEKKIKINYLNLPLHEGFIDITNKILCYTDHQIFQRYHKFKEKKSYSQDKILSIKNLQMLQAGDYLTHIDYGVGRFSGMQKITINGTIQESVRMIYKDGDVLFVNINALYKLSKYSSKDGATPSIHKIGSDAWAQIKQKTKKKIKELAFDLIKLYAKRKANKGFAFSPDNFMQYELEASFIYEDTPDQATVSLAIKKDMEAEAPMDRLVCGDVGFGKTELAVRAAFKACCDSKQVAVLVPTTVLAFQHYKTFSERLKGFPVCINFMNRFKTSTEKTAIQKELSEGKIDIIIGTHALLNKKIQFKNLGLMIIDEEQKFGVAAKDTIKTNYINVDCLTLSATPIPRTLQFSLMGARDLSTINTPPPNRQSVNTAIHNFNLDFIKEKINDEVERGGQVFFVHNRVQNILEMKDLLQKACPELSIAHAHGQMEGKELEDTLLDFIDKKYDVLLSTNIIESGLDITNVNTIFINNAHEFGLSDLHQLRGRVGRNNLKAHCFLLISSLKLLSQESKKKLRIIEQFSDLGSGFHIAMKDLDLRGAGNILGAEQSGFINEVGLDAYQKILNEAMRELKQQDFKELFADSVKDVPFVEDCIVETDLEIFIPDVYMEQSNERLAFYTKINHAKNNEDLQKIKTELQDRFGELPQQVLDLFTIMLCRKMGIILGFEKLVLKNKELKCFFSNNPNSPFFESNVFKNILKYIQEGTNKATVKQSIKSVIIIFENVNSIEQFYAELDKMKMFVINSNINV